MIYRLLLLLLIGITIVIYHVKASIYNKEQENSIIGSKKDIWPFRILWILWSIVLLGTLLFLSKKDNIPTINELVNLNQNITKNNETNRSNKNIYRQIIDQKRQSELSGNKKAIINPIISGYYELITENKKLIQQEEIIDGYYPIPKPINISYCNTDDKYWNLGSTYGLNYNGFIYEYLNSNKKKDIVIGVLDTGVTAKNAKLKAHLIGTGKNIIKQNNNTLDTSGHGSHIAGIILQTFPNAYILPIKISEDNNENISKSDIIAGLKYAIDQNVDIINMSFGGLEQDPITNELIHEAVNKGILIVAAAGNESQNVNLYYPASYGGVISVGSVGKIGKSEFSNYGADIEMPGECIYSTSIGGNSIFMDGTSTSAPHLAGIIGSYLSLDNKVLHKSEIIKLINKNLKFKNGKKILDITKFLDIEEQNNEFYEKLANINSILKEVQNKITSLQLNLTNEGLQETINYINKYKTTLQKNSKEIEDLYKSLNITEGFGIGLSKKINDYINILKNLLTNEGVQLTSKNSVLGLSLGTSICNIESRICTIEERKKGCDDSHYPTRTCGFFSAIISAGAKLPVEGSGLYCTIEDYQTSLYFPVYQGSDEFAKGNKYLGEITLNGLPSRLKGQACATVYFKIDKYGYLSAEAVDNSNGLNRVMKTKLTPATNSVENKGNDYDKILTNIGYALSETNDLISQIKQFYNVDPWNYINTNTSGITNRIEHTTTEVVANNKIETNISEENTTNNNTTYSPDEKNISVIEVTDGDTIKISLNGKTQSVRLIGVDAPESYDTRYGYTECFGKESANYLKKLISNKQIDLEYDTSQGLYDKYNRILAFVFYKGENINEKIIKEGYGREYTYNLPHKYQKEFQLAQKYANNNDLGLRNSKTCNGERKKK